MTSEGRDHIDGHKPNLGHVGIINDDDDDKEVHKTVIYYMKRLFHY